MRAIAVAYCVAGVAGGCDVPTTDAVPLDDTGRALQLVWAATWFAMVSDHVFGLTSTDSTASAESVGLTADSHASSTLGGCGTHEIGEGVATRTETVSVTLGADGCPLWAGTPISGELEFLVLFEEAIPPAIDSAVSLTVSTDTLGIRGSRSIGRRARYIPGISAIPPWIEVETQIDDDFAMAELDLAGGFVFGWVDSTPTANVSFSMRGEDCYPHSGTIELGSPVDITIELDETTAASGEASAVAGDGSRSPIRLPSYGSCPSIE